MQGKLEPRARAKTHDNRPAFMSVSPSAHIWWCEGSAEEMAAALFPTTRSSANCLLMPILTRNIHGRKNNSGKHNFLSSQVDTFKSITVYPLTPINTLSNYNKLKIKLGKQGQPSFQHDIPISAIPEVYNLSLERRLTSYKDLGQKFQLFFL